MLKSSIFFLIFCSIRKTEIIVVLKNGFLDLMNLTYFFVSCLSRNHTRIKEFIFRVFLQLKISRVIRNRNLLNNGIIHNFLLCVIFILIIPWVFKQVLVRLHLCFFMIKLLTRRNFLNAGVPFFCQVKELSACNSLKMVLVLLFISFVLSMLHFQYFSVFIWLCWLY